MRYQLTIQSWMMERLIFEKVAAYRQNKPDMAVPEHYIPADLPDEDMPRAPVEDDAVRAYDADLAQAIANQREYRPDVFTADPYFQ